MSVDDGLRALFRANLRKGFHWQSVETGFTSRGVPDSNCCCVPGVEFWVEFKSVRRGWAVKIRPEQVGWLLTRERHGGRTFVAVRRRVEGADELYVYRGSVARDLKDRGLLAVPLLRCSGGPSRWDWDAVSSILVV